MTFIIVWTVIFPLTIVKLLKNNKTLFSSEKHLKIYGIFYIGLKDNAYFWEIIVVTYRKIILIICSTIIQSEKQMIKVTQYFKYFLGCRRNPCTFHSETLFSQ